MTEQRFTVTVTTPAGDLASEEIEAPSAWQAVLLAARRGLLPADPFTLKVDHPKPAGSPVGSLLRGSWSSTPPWP